MKTSLVHSEIFIQLFFKRTNFLKMYVISQFLTYDFSRPEFAFFLSWYFSAILALFFL